MKKLILASAMVFGFAATASSANYGGEPVEKTKTVCGYGRHSSSANDCKVNNYKFFAPKIQRMCKRLGKKGDGPVFKCWDRLTSGNFATRAFGSAAEARETNRLEGKRNRTRP